MANSYQLKVETCVTFLCLCVLGEIFKHTKKSNTEFSEEKVTIRNYVKSVKFVNFYNESKTLFRVIT